MDRVFLTYKAREGVRVYITSTFKVFKTDSIS